MDSHRVVRYDPEQIIANLTLPAGIKAIIMEYVESKSLLVLGKSNIYLIDCYTGECYTREHGTTGLTTFEHWSDGEVAKIAICGSAGIFILDIFSLSGRFSVLDDSGTTDWRGFNPQGVVTTINPKDVGIPTGFIDLMVGNNDSLYVLKPGGDPYEMIVLKLDQLEWEEIATIMVDMGEHKIIQVEHWLVVLGDPINVIDLRTKEVRTYFPPTDNKVTTLAGVVGTELFILPAVEQSTIHVLDIVTGIWRLITLEITILDPVLVAVCNCFLA